MSSVRHNLATIYPTMRNVHCELAMTPCQRKAQPAIVEFWFYLGAHYPDLLMVHKKKPQTAPKSIKEKFKNRRWAQMLQLSEILIWPMEICSHV